MHRLENLIANQELAKDVIMENRYGAHLLSEHEHVDVIRSVLRAKEMIDLSPLFQKYDLRNRGTLVASWGGKIYSPALHWEAGKHYLEEEGGYFCVWRIAEYGEAHLLLPFKCDIWKYSILQVFFPAKFLSFAGKRQFELLDCIAAGVKNCHLVRTKVYVDKDVDPTGPKTVDLISLTHDRS